MAAAERSVSWSGVQVGRKARLELPLRVYGQCEIVCRFTLAAHTIEVAAALDGQPLPRREAAAAAPWGAELAFEVARAGIVELCFDNSFSLLRGKTLTELQLVVRREAAAAVPADALGMPPVETLTLVRIPPHTHTPRPAHGAPRRRRCGASSEWGALASPLHPIGCGSRARAPVTLARPPKCSRRTPPGGGARSHLACGRCSFSRQGRVAACACVARVRPLTPAACRSA